MSPFFELVVHTPATTGRPVGWVSLHVRGHRIAGLQVGHTGPLGLIGPKAHRLGRISWRWMPAL